MIPSHEPIYYGGGSGIVHAVFRMVEEVARRYPDGRDCASVTRTEGLVPPDHPIRRIKPLADRVLQELSPTLTDVRQGGQAVRAARAPAEGQPAHRSLCHPWAKGGRNAWMDFKDEYGRQPMAEDVCAVLDALGIPRSDVLGFSMGGTAVYSLLNSAPDRVGAAVVLGEQPFRGMWEQGPTWIQRIQEGGMPAMVASIEERGPMQPERKQRLLASDPVATVACIRALLDLPSLESDLPSITTPCLLIAGEYDEAFDAMKSASSLMPNASFVALTGLGHIQSFRHTDLVVSRVIRFLDTVQSTKCA